MNDYTFTGRLGQDCRVATLDNGQIVINFSVAVDRSYKDKEGQKIDKTDWHNCAWWVKADKVSKFLLKGALVAVRGIPYAKSYISNHGELMQQLAVKVDKVDILIFPEKPATHDSFPIKPMDTEDDGMPF